MVNILLRTNYSNTRSIILIFHLKRRDTIK